MVNQCVKCGEKGTTGFFTIPKKPSIRKDWILAAMLSENLLTQTGQIRMCWRHFHQSSFDTRGQRLTLKKGRPIIFTFFSRFFYLK